MSDLSLAQPQREVSLFSFDGNQVRTLTINGEPWFVATDVAAALEYRDALNMVRCLDEDEKHKMDLEILVTNQHVRGCTHTVSIPSLPVIQGGLSTMEKEVYVINESGLYSVILRSRKESAKRFKKWVTSELLPAVRRGEWVPVADYLALRDEVLTLRHEVKELGEKLSTIMDPSLMLPSLREDVIFNLLLEEKETILLMLRDPIKEALEEGLRNLVVTPSATEPSLLTSAQLAFEKRVSCRRMNQILSEVGLQQKVGIRWVPTPSARTFCEVGRTSKKLRWRTEVLDQIDQSYFL